VLTTLTAFVTQITNAEGMAKKFPDLFELVTGDIRNPDHLKGIFQKTKFDFVVHLAARAGVRPSISDPLLYQDVNIRGTIVLLESCKAHGIKNFIFASSSSVYGENQRVPFTEEDLDIQPISPYGATKRAGELLCYSYHHLYGDGSSRRDYTFIDDLIEGVLAIIRHHKGFEIYNLGESQTTPLKELIGLIEEALGKRAEIEEMGSQPGDVSITYADIAKARQMLGYQPRVRMEEGIKRFVDWYNQAKGSFSLP